MSLCTWMTSNSLQKRNDKKRRFWYRQKIYSQDTEMNFCIEKCADNENRKRQITERVKLSNQKGIWMLGEKETYIYLGILEADTIKLMKIRKKLKFLRRTRKLLETKHLSCLLCNILGTILKIDEGRTQTYRPEDKKTSDDVYGLISEWWHR